MKVRAPLERCTLKKRWLQEKKKQAKILVEISEENNWFYETSGRVI